MYMYVNLFVFISTLEQCDIQLKGLSMKNGSLLPKPVITMVNTIMFLGAQVFILLFIFIYLFVCLFICL